MLVKQELKPLPFLTTHVANLALNKKIGLIFLQDGPQETHGLTTISEESLANDQLQVAAWMIQHFMGWQESDQSLSATAQPWAELDEYDPSTPPLDFDAVGIKHMEDIANQITSELDGIMGDPWDHTNIAARRLLFRVLRQTEECVRYNNDRIAIVQLSADLDKVHDKGGQVDLFEHIMSGGPSIGRRMAKLIEREGIVGILTAYLRTKNAVTPGMILGRYLKNAVVKFIEPHATGHGYTSNSATQEN